MLLFSLLHSRHSVPPRAAPALKSAPEDWGERLRDDPAVGQPGPVRLRHQENRAQGVRGARPTSKTAAATQQTAGTKAAHRWNHRGWVIYKNKYLQKVKLFTFRTVFSGLHGIELSNNPWDCDCRLRPLKHWLITYNVPYTDEPVCASPSRINGKTFGSLDVDEFACPPEIISAPRYVEAKSGKLPDRFFFSRSLVFIANAIIR